MVKHLTVTYDPGSGPLQLFDGEVAELTFTDTGNGIKIEGRITKPAARAANQSGFFDLISKASKASTQKIAEDKRAALPVNGGAVGA